MAAQHLPRDLVRPNSGLNNWLKKRRNLTNNDTFFKRLKPVKGFSLQQQTFFSKHFLQ